MSDKGSSNARHRVADNEETVGLLDQQSDSDDVELSTPKNKGISKNAQSDIENTKFVSIFCLDLSVLSTSVVFTILFSIIMVGFLCIGFVEEGFKIAFPTFSFGWFMTAIELLIFSAFAALERTTKRNPAMALRSLTAVDGNPSDMDGATLKPAFHRSIASMSAVSLSKIVERKVELKYHIIVAAAMTASRGLTNIALLLLNYPTQVIFKSMKLISVMIGSRFVLQKQYTIYEYVAAPLMVFAAISFSVGDKSEPLQFHFWGTVVVCVSLIFDSIHANAQEFTLRLHRDTALELLVYSNFFSGVFAAIVAVLVGELVPFIEFFQTTSFVRIFKWFLIRVVCLYLGVSALVVFTKRFGCVASATVTTIRKVLTVLLSYMIWPEAKVFTRIHGFGTVMFIISLFLNSVGVSTKSSK